MDSGWEYLSQHVMFVVPTWSKYCCSRAQWNNRFQSHHLPCYRCSPLNAGTEPHTQPLCDIAPFVRCRLASPKPFWKTLPPPPAHTYWPHGPHLPHSVFVPVVRWSRNDDVSWSDHGRSSTGNITIVITDLLMLDNSCSKKYFLSIKMTNTDKPLNRWTIPLKANTCS